VPSYVRALRYFRDDLGRIAALVSVLFASTLAAALQAWPVAVLVDSVAAPNARADLVHRLVLAPLPTSVAGRVAGLAVMVFALRVAQELLGFVRIGLAQRIAHGGLVRVRADLFERLTRQSLAYHRAQPAGDALHRLSDDAAGCQAIVDVTLSIVVSGVLLAVMATVMLSRHVGLTLLALGVAPLLVLVNLHFARGFEARCDDAKERQAELFTSIERAMGAIRVVQAFGREPDEGRRFRSRAERSARAWLALRREEARYGLTVGALFAAGGAAIVGWGGLLVARREMTPGDITVFLAYLGMLYDPLCKLSGARASLEAGLAGVRRVFDVLDHAPSIRDADDAVALPRAPRTLRLDRVSFAYRAGHAVLRDVSVTIPPGAMVAFVGASGVGKSTLLHLVPRFHDPAEGAVLLDDTDLRRARVADVRRHVALVLQESLVLAASVAENIAYGRPSATPAEIRRAAELAGAADFIDALPDGWDTRLGDGGHHLSGGQRQRIAIARALVTEAPILVVDEPTSALDAESEARITETLVALKRLRTIVIVSHRVSTVAPSDRIVVLHGGRVAERGTHAELLAKGGAYHDLARRQLHAPDLGRALAVAHERAPAPARGAGVAPRDAELVAPVATE
jgi:subfamily B ATP-binding cassette protein MsbA